MPVIGATFSRGCSDGARGFADLELFFGLAQRNRGRKTTYFDAVHGTGKLKAYVDPASASGAWCAEEPFVFEPPCSRKIPQSAESAPAVRVYSAGRSADQFGQSPFSCSSLFEQAERAEAHRHDGTMASEHGPGQVCPGPSGLAAFGDPPLRSTCPCISPAAPKPPRRRSSATGHRSPPAPARRGIAQGPAY